MKTYEKIEAIKETYNEKIPNYCGKLNSGVSREEIELAESILGVILPKEFKVLYSIHNGNIGDALCGFILGLEFLSIKSILHEWNLGNKAVFGWTNEELEMGKSIPCGAIKCLCHNPKWIPFAHDSSGNYIGIDFDPDVNGVNGQIITFGRDENDKVVIANSFDEFLNKMLIILRSEDCVVDCESYEEDVLVFNGCYHINDYFKEI